MAIPAAVPEKYRRLPVREEERSLLGTLGHGALMGLSAAGNLLDLPGSSIRDILSGENPLDQWASPFSYKNRVSGRELGEEWGLIGANQVGKLDLGDVAGFGIEVATDPLSYVMPFGALTKGGEIARSAGALKGIGALTGKGSNRAAKATTSLDDLVRGARETGNFQLESSLGQASQKMGFKSLDDALQQVGSEPLSGRVGFGFPFRPASKVVGKKPLTPIEMPSQFGEGFQRVRKGLVDTFGEDQGSALSQLTAARASAWASETGGVADEWFERIKDIQSGGEFDKVDIDGMRDFLLQGGRRDVAPQWYSKLQRTIDEKVGGKVGRDQLNSTLKKAGVKSEEIEWAELDGLFEGRKLVSKELLQDWVRGHSVELEETWRSQGPMQEIWEAADTMHGAVWGEGQTREEALRNAMREVGGDIQEADFVLRQGEIEVGDTTRYGQYTLPGGQNYKELLLRMPRKHASFADMQRYNELDRIITYSTDAAEREAAFAERAQIQEILQKGAADEFKSSHWDEPNVLAHVRMNDRVGPKGERILHVEEIQSDWHQAGRKEGYQPSAEESRLTQEKLAQLESRNADAAGPWADVRKELTGKVIEATRRVREAEKVASTRFHEPDIQGATALERLRKRSAAYDIPGGATEEARLELQNAKDELHALQLIQQSSQGLQAPVSNTPWRRGTLRNEFVADMDDFAKRHDAARKEWHESWRELDDFRVEQTRVKDRPPNAPFKKTWHELAMKRVLRHAAEEGYDRVTWTTGAQQNKRYGLSQVVDSIEWDTGGSFGGHRAMTSDDLTELGLRVVRPDTTQTQLYEIIDDASGELISSGRTLDEALEDLTRTGTFDQKSNVTRGVRINTRGGEADIAVDVDISGVITDWSTRGIGDLQQDLTGRRLEEIVGQGPARRIMGEDRGRMAGEGLDIGGEGMKGFYDNMLPKFVQKYTKKWGGRVGATKLRTEAGRGVRSDNLNAAEDFVDDLARTMGGDPNDIDFGDWVAVTEEGEIIDSVGVWPTDSALVNEMRRAGVRGRPEMIGNLVPNVPKSEAVHAIDVTPTMKDKILTEGQPLFQRAEEAVKGMVQFDEENQALINFFQSADVSTGAHEIAHVFRRDIAESQPEILKALEDGLGVVDGQWDELAEESFAYGFERYLREGTSGLGFDDLFERFKKWLTEIYNKVSGTPLEAEISPEMREVFDQMIDRPKQIPQSRVPNLRLQPAIMARLANLPMRTGG